MAIVRCVLKSSSEAKIGKAERIEGTRIASPPDGPLDAEGANNTHYSWVSIFRSSTLPGIVMKSLPARKYMGKDRSRGKGETHVASEVTQLDADFLERYSCRMDLDPRVYVIS